MAREERAVFTNMCMISDASGNVLVQNRNSKDWPGVTFPGGHVEPGESFVQSVIREVQEETGLTIENPRLCGIKQFQTDDGARYVVLLYRTETFSGVLKSSDEGEVFWIKKDGLAAHALPVDFLPMDEVFETEKLTECYYEKTPQDAWEMRLM